MREKRRELPRLNERHRRAGDFAEHRLREVDSTGWCSARGRHGGAAGPSVLALPGTARAYDPTSNESLADFIKRQNMGSFTLGPFQLNALELANVAATLASGGVWCPPSPIDRIFDRHGNEVSIPSQPCDQAVPEGLANTLANALSKDSQSPGTGAGAASSVGWTLPMSGKTGTTESHRSSGFVGFTNHYAAANYVFADSSNPSGICSFPLRECYSGDLFGGNEPARTWFEAMKPIATDFGDLQLPPTDPRYVDGAPGGRVPSVSGLKVDAARQRLKDAGFQVAGQTTSVSSSASYGAVVGTTPSGQTFPGSIITINTSNGIPPAPPPRPVEPPPVDEPGGVPAPPPPVDPMIVEIPGLPPFDVPVPGPPPPLGLPPPPDLPPPPGPPPPP